MDDNIHKLSNSVSLNLLEKQNSRRMLRTETNTWQQFKTCIDDKTDKHPCWQAEILPVKADSHENDWT